MLAQAAFTGMCGLTTSAVLNGFADSSDQHMADAPEQSGTFVAAAVPQLLSMAADRKPYERIQPRSDETGRRPSE